MEWYRLYRTVLDIVSCVVMPAMGPAKNCAAELQYLQLSAQLMSVIV